MVSVPVTRHVFKFRFQIRWCDSDCMYIYNIYITRVRSPSLAVSVYPDLPPLPHLCVCMNACTSLLRVITGVYIHGCHIIYTYIHCCYMLEKQNDPLKIYKSAFWYCRVFSHSNQPASPRECCRISCRKRLFSFFRADTQLVECRWSRDLATLRTLRPGIIDEHRHILRNARWNTYFECCEIVPYEALSRKAYGYFVVWYHIISYYVVRYHIISYHVVW